MTNLIRIHIKTKLIRFGIEVYLVLFEYLIMEGRLIMSEINSIDVEEDQFAYRYLTKETKIWMKMKYQITLQSILKETV